jgi:hypothetical protein
MEKTMHRCDFVENRCGHAVYEITRSEESFIPIAQGQRLKEMCPRGNNKWFICIFHIIHNKFNPIL